MNIAIPKEMGIDFSPEEDADSYIGNALIKAEALYRIVHEPVLADDSGLEVDALGSAPGIHTARYGGEGLSSEERYTLLLKNMKNVTERGASFIACLVLIVDERRKYIIQEECRGRITEEPSGMAGFGYDPVFFVDDAGMTAAELPEGVKDRYSHRGKAARLMNAVLKEEGFYD